MKTERQKFVKILDDLFREIIRKRDKVCQRCGRSDIKLEVAHFYSRAIKKIRWSEDNCCLLCFNCHYKFAHREPAEFAEWWEVRFGKEKLAQLRLRKTYISTLHTHELKVLKIALKKRLEELR